MEKGDKVMVNWPTGRGGPYKVKKFAGREPYYISIRIDNCDDIGSFATAKVPQDWCEPAEPGIEKGRLVYVGSELGTRGKLAIPYGEEARTWRYKEPVHRRWDELSESEKYELNSVVKNDEDPNNVKTIFCYIYKLITGEEHP
jgi:hypothetical protein